MNAMFSVLVVPLALGMALGTAAAEDAAEPASPCWDLSVSDDMAFSEIRTRIATLEPSQGVECALLFARAASDPRLAASLAQLACTIAKANDLPTAPSLHLLADIARYRKDMASCAAFLREARADAKARGDAKRLAVVAADLGNAVFLLDLYEESFGAYGEALELSRESNEELLEARVIFGMSEVCNRQQNHEWIEENLPRAIEIHERLGSVGFLADCYKMQANVQSVRSEWEKAVANYAKALDLYAKADNLHGAANCHYNLGLLRKDTGAYDEAIGEYERARLLFLRIGSMGGTAMCMTAWAEVLRLQSRFPEAKAMLLQAEPLAVDDEGAYRKAAIHEGLGRVESCMRNMEPAREQYRLAIETYTSIGLYQNAEQASTSLQEIMDVE